MTKKNKKNVALNRFSELYLEYEMMCNITGDGLPDTFREYESSADGVKMLSDVVWDLIELYMDDAEVLPEAIKLFPWLYYRLPESVRANREVAKAAAGRKTVKHFPDQLLNDDSFMEEIYWIDSQMIARETVERVITNMDKLLAHIKKDAYFVRNIPERWEIDRDFWLKAVQVNGLSIHFLPVEFWKDREIALKAVQQFGIALKYCHSSFQSDPEIVKAAVTQYESSVVYANPELFETDPELSKMKELLKKHGNSYGVHKFKG